MSKLLRFICMAAVLTPLAGCKNEDEPEQDSQPVEETWLMTYDDYHSLLYVIKEDEKQKYRTLTRELSVIRDEDEISIKGIFAEYPDAWIKGRIIGNKVYISESRSIAPNDGNPVYFHWGYADSYPEDRTTGDNFPSYIEFSTSSGHAFIISEDRTSMTSPYSKLNIAFWHDDNNQEYFYYSEDTGFPDVDIKVNISFRKISNKSGVK